MKAFIPVNEVCSSDMGSSAQGWVGCSGASHQHVLSNYFLHLSWQLCILGVQHSPLLRSLALREDAPK